MSAPHNIRKTMAFTKKQWEYIRTEAFKLNISPSEFVRRCIEEGKGNTSQTITTIYDVSDEIAVIAKKLSEG